MVKLSAIHHACVHSKSVSKKEKAHQPSEEHMYMYRLLFVLKLHSFVHNQIYQNSAGLASTYFASSVFVFQGSDGVFNTGIKVY